MQERHPEPTSYVGLCLSVLYAAIALTFLSSLAAPVDSAELPVSWFFELSEGSSLGVEITGTVDTTLDTFSVESFLVDGPITLFTPAALPIEMMALDVDGFHYDVPDDFDGITDDWGFFGPLLSDIAYVEGTTSAPGRMSWGFSEALSGLTFGVDERVMHLAANPISGATLIARDKSHVSVPEPVAYALLAPPILLLLGIASCRRS